MEEVLWTEYSLYPTNRVFFSYLNIYEKRHMFFEVVMFHVLTSCVSFDYVVNREID